jgi:hypothetical protein
VVLADQGDPPDLGELLNVNDRDAGPWVDPAAVDASRADPKTRLLQRLPDGGTGLDLAAWNVHGGFPSLHLPIRR